jgi:hypothetical protein
VSRPRFEHGTSRLRIISGNHSTVILNRLVKWQVNVRSSSRRIYMFIAILGFMGQHISFFQHMLFVYCTCNVRRTMQLSLKRLISCVLLIARTCWYVTRYTVVLVILQSRQVFLGLCLPQSCGPADITSLLRPDDALQVLRVRPVPGDYSLLADTKFYVLG